MDNKKKKTNKMEEFSRTVEKKFIAEIDEFEKEDFERQEAKKQKELLSKVAKEQNIQKKSVHKRSLGRNLKRFSNTLKQRLADSKVQIKTFLRIIFHPKTTAQLGLAATIFLLFSAVVVVVVANIQAANFILPSSSKKSFLDQTGEAQLLDSFSKSAVISEKPLSIRFDGILLQQNDTCYATFTVDGITATFIENDYIGPFKIEKISDAGVTLDHSGEKIVLDFINNKYDVPK